MYYAGWDGGGTKTAVCLINPSGELLSEAFFGPMNLNGASADLVEHTILSAVSWMAMQPGGLEACGGLVVGTAGISNPEARKLEEDFIRRAGYSGKLRIVGDQEIALAGAIEGPGAVLIAGTGSICVGRDGAGNLYRVGGRGYLIDDEGSGYAIGRDILSAVMRAEDGRAVPTCLTELVFHQLQAGSISEIIGWVYDPAHGKKEISSLSPLLLTALDQGDAAAQAIADRAARELAALVLAFWNRAGLREGELALTGSILQRYTPIRQAMTDRILARFPDIHIGSPRHSPAHGAAWMARRFGSD